MSCREEHELPRSSLRSFPHMSIYSPAIRHGSLVHHGSSSSIRPEQDIVSTEELGSLLFSFVTARPMRYFRVFTHAILYSWQIWTNTVLGALHTRRNNKPTNRVDHMAVCFISLFYSNQSSHSRVVVVMYIYVRRYTLGVYEWYSWIIFNIIHV